MNGDVALEFVDVLIVGAGLSGIGAACHLKRRCPERSLAIVEARSRLGGTWDLFRYPGVRSDSDMHTLGYSFRPWTGEKSIAGGPEILSYLRDTAGEEGVEPLIRYGHRVRGASWSSADARWTVEIERAGKARPLRLRCAFLLLCAGYYDSEEGYCPDFAGRDEFAGRIVHPQHWPEDFDASGQQVVVIGSGATAVTLVPALAEGAAQVTMLQRSPTYMATRPSVDTAANWLRRRLGPRLAHGINRWRSVLFGMYVYRLCMRQPQRAKAGLIAMVRQQLGPDYDVATHFTPRYKPWEQRLCLVPDGDLFAAMRAGKVSIVTDQIERFTATGLRLASGTELPADVVVTATGLKLEPLGALALTVDGRPVDPAQLLYYKGVMFGGVPNLASIVGYVNASWTLKADLSSVFVCRLLLHMKRRGLRECRPRVEGSAEGPPAWAALSSGYVQRAAAQLPKQGARRPWKLNQNYIADLLALRWGALDDGVMQFTPGRAQASV
ncbi:MAG TPA: NAD(P)/FAD-dependent oxidoreductase [Variovorax sp.]|nr:NAD(P)/FAD-dependent oxidoreductase [Variovorax sp.]